MDPFREHLIVRAATIDELLSHDFETLSGQKGDAGTAAQRLAAWCSACASGDWSLFNRRLERDGVTIQQVLARFATARRKVSVPPPTWIGDAVWIEAALQSLVPGELIVIGRFIPGGRTAVTLSAGTLQYPWRRFVLFDAAAALIWALYATLLGYFGGRAFEDAPWKGLLLALGIAFAVAGLIELTRWLLKRRRSSSPTTSRD